MSTASSVPDPADPTAWLSLSELAESTGEQQRRIRQLVREGRLVTVKQAGTEQVPAAFVADGRLLRGLGGVTTLLHDAGYSPAESLRWLFTENEVLGASPVQAMTEGRPTEVKRVAQTLGF